MADEIAHPFRTRRAAAAGEHRYAIGIGAQKCASSWVHAVLARHPGVSVSRRKEVDFFSYHHDAGYGWYARQWGAPGLRFENSPSYLHDPRSPARLKRFAPDARIVVTLRDPVERAFSHHLHAIAHGHIPPGPFEAALDANPDYLEQGFYARHLVRWQAEFPAARILALMTEDIAAAPLKSRRALLDFLGLDHTEPPAATGDRWHVSDVPRSGLLRRLLRTGGDGLRSLGMEDGLTALKRTAPITALLRWNSRPLRAEVAPPSDRLRFELAELFAEDMAALAEMLGRRDLPWESWRLAGRPGPRIAQR